MSDYETDFYRWTQTQATALRVKDFAALDVDNLAEEIESLGRSDRRAIVSHLEGLLLHLLKWREQPQTRGPSWRSTIRHARREIAKLLAESPSLHDYPARQIIAAYRHARQDAADETGHPLATFPEACPWVPEQILDADFWPEVEAKEAASSSGAA
jgi:ribosomal protein L29